LEKRKSGNHIVRKVRLQSYCIPDGLRGYGRDGLLFNGLTPVDLKRIVNLSVHGISRHSILKNELCLSYKS
jgi:hypothetical protein